MSAASDVIELESTISSNINLNEQIIIYAAIIEEEIITPNNDTMRNVFKKFLPDPGGTLFNETWTPGMSRTVNLSWEIDVNIYDSTQLGAVVFVQNRTTEEILQTDYIKLSNKDIPLITGIEDKFLSQIENVRIYPNPVENFLNFTIDEPVNEEYTWKIIDQRGVVMLKGNLDFRNNYYRTSTNSIPNGIYFVVIGIKDHPLVYKKIVVVHQ